MEQELNNNNNQGYYGHTRGNGHLGGDEGQGQHQQQQQHQQQYHPGGPPPPLPSSTAAAAAATATFSPTPATNNTTNSTYAPQEPTPPPAVALARSSPIAIQRPHSHSPSSSGGGRYHFGNQGRSGDVTSDDDDDDDDDYDNTTTNIKTSTQNTIIDVEGDAKKLRRKYGNQSTVTGVVHNQNVVQTYQQESSYLRQGLARDNNEPLLKAPYFGSLNRSADQVLSLPPMSLESAGLGIGGGTMDEPPDSIPSSASALGSMATATGTATTRTAYGSLRDSQEKGRFLDGPSSYREPTSGRIRQLDHRVRYHGRTAGSPQVSISERMQQARKLKETRQKELANADSAVAAPSGSATNTSTSTSTSASGTTTPSSLSAMMDEVSKNEDPRPAVLQPMTAASENNRWGDNSYRGGLGHIGDVDDDDDVDNNDNDNDNDVPHAMLSTSLTAFEVLKTTNVMRGPSGGGAMNMATTTNSSSLLPPTSSTPVFTTDGRAVNNNNNATLVSNATLPTGLASINANSPYHGSAVHQQRPGAVIRQDRFQPLSRSLSDPSPGYQQQQFSLRERTALMSSPTYGPVAANTTPTSPTVQFSLPPPQQQRQQYPQYLAPAGFGVVASTAVAVAAATAPQNDDGSLIQSDTERQISETEGAFGDMDLE